MYVILCAMDCELVDFTAALSQNSALEIGPFSGAQGLLEGRQVALFKSGVGKVLSAAITQLVIDKLKPQAAFFTGIAGALNSNYSIGDVIVSHDLIQHDLDGTAFGWARGQIPYTDIRILTADTNLLRHSQGYRSKGHELHVGRILSGDQFITGRDRASHEYLIKELNGDAVEMEGASFATIASINHVPFLVVRTISDRADGSSPADFEAFLPTASKNSLGLMRHILAQLPA